MVSIHRGISRVLSVVPDYKSVITRKINPFINEEIIIDRFRLSYKPWENWNGEQNPNWWKSYNKVKHQRNNYFNEANLKNSINAVGALLVTVIYYYKYAFSKDMGNEISFKETTRQLQPEASLLRINADYYSFKLLV